MAPATAAGMTAKFNTGITINRVTAPPNPNAAIRDSLSPLPLLTKIHSMIGQWVVQVFQCKKPSVKENPKKGAASWTIGTRNSRSSGWREPESRSICEIRETSPGTIPVTQLSGESGSALPVSNCSALAASIPLNGAASRLAIAVKV